MKFLLVLNDPPYGSERCYNALRLALALHKTDAHPEIVIFLMADAVVAAKAGQKTPAGYYRLKSMLKAAVGHGEVLLCGSCMDARGVRDDEIIGGTRRSTMAQFADHAITADKVLVF